MFKKITDLVKEQEVKRIAQKCAFRKPKNMDNENPNEAKMMIMTDPDQVVQLFGLKDSALVDKIRKDENFKLLQQELIGNGYNIVIGKL